MKNREDLPLYYQYTNPSYKPTEAEEDFHNEILYYAFDEDSSKANFAESFIMFQYEMEDDDNVKIYLFTSLIEALDQTQLSAKKSLLFETLDLVLAQYKNDLSSVIDFYLSSDIFTPNIKSYLRLCL